MDSVFGPSLENKKEEFIRERVLISSSTLKENMDRGREVEMTMTESSSGVTESELNKIIKKKRRSKVKRLYRNFIGVLLCKLCV